MAGKDRGRKAAKKPAERTLREKRAAKRDKAQSGTSILKER